jgi:hypothetical protein
MTCDRSRATAVGSWRLTAWAMTPASIWLTILGEQPSWEVTFNEFVGTGWCTGNCLHSHSEVPDTVRSDRSVHECWGSVGEWRGGIVISYTEFIIMLSSLPTLCHLFSWDSVTKYIEINNWTKQYSLIYCSVTECFKKMHDKINWILNTYHLAFVGI